MAAISATAHHVLTPRWHVCFCLLCSISCFSLPSVCARAVYQKHYSVFWLDQDGPLSERDSEELSSIRGLRYVVVRKSEAF